MKFNSLAGAQEYWEQAANISGGLDTLDESVKTELFYIWVRKSGVTWLSKDDEKFISSFEGVF